MTRGRDRARLLWTARATLALLACTAVACGAFDESKKERKERKKEEKAERKEQKAEKAAGDHSEGAPGSTVRKSRDWSRFPAVVDMKTDADVVGLVSKAVARTNAAGRFALGDLAPGPEFFLVRAIGFLPQRFPATLVAGDTVPLDIVLGPAPQQLAELTVTAYGKAYTGKLAHFGHRMLTTAAPRSSFIELDELEEWAKADLAHVLRRTGLRIRIVNNRLVLSCPHENNESYTRVPLIAVYLDGALAQNEPFFDVATFPVQWIAAIEVYRRITEAPIEFQALTAGCAILITTK